MPTQTLQVKVKPNAKTSSLSAMSDGTWRAELKASPVDGKANAELIALVAAHFGCRKADVSIQTGAASRMKRIKIETR